MKEYKLTTGKVITEAELDELRDIIHKLDDIEEVESKLATDVYEGDPLYGEIPERYIAEIAEKKSYYERQQSYSWDEAIDEAVYRWADEHFDRLLNTFYAAWVKIPGNEDTTREEFENTNGMFHCATAMKALASEEDFEVWQVVVAAESEG